MVIIRLKRLLVLVLVCIVGLPLVLKSENMDNIDFNLKQFKKDIFNFQHKGILIPDELGISYPIPYKKDEEGKYLFKFFYYYMRRGPEGKFIISVPKYVAEADYVSKQVTVIEKIDPEYFGLKSESITIGIYDPEKSLPNTVKLQNIDILFEQYNQITPLYLDNVEVTDAQSHLINDFTLQLKQVILDPLYPMYMYLNPDFFSWLDNNSSN